MPGIRETRRLPYSCEEMFDLVANVARYQEFLPWVVATRVRSDSETEMVADMLVGFKALREKFTSRVIKDRPQRIEVIYVDGPLKDLDNVWEFAPLEDGGCEVHFCVDFAFKNMMFQALALSAPFLVTAMVVGLAVSLFQAVTSIHEQTLTFVPKALAIVGVMLLMLPWMVRSVMEFTTAVIEKIPQMVQ